MLNTHHNLSYYIGLMADARKAIENKAFGLFRKEFYRKREVEHCI
jgi:queuine tRNA-ribosyltransferase